MKKQRITSINEEIIHIADKYIKKVIINTRNAYFKNKSQLNKQGIIFLNIESYEDFLASNDDNFEELYCCYINENGFKIPVKNTQLGKQFCV